MIPEAAVEAAARAEYGNGDEYGTWETEPAEVREMYLNDARKMLEAAAPHMLEGAYTDGYCDGMSGDPHNLDKYRPAK